MNRYRIVAAIALATAGIGAAITLGPTAATGASRGHDAWRGQPVGSRAEALRVTHASAPNTLTLTSVNGRQEFIDVGTPDSSVGDYILLNIRLFNEAGDTRVGRGTVRCEFGFGTQPCHATFLILGKGQITVDGVIYRNRPSVNFAILGGTGQYRGTSGVMQIVSTPGESLLVLHFTN